MITFFIICLFGLTVAPLQPSTILYPAILTVTHTYALNLQRNPLYGVEFVTNFGDTILIERRTEPNLYKLLEEGDVLLMHAEESSGVTIYSDGYITLRGR